MPQVPGVDNPEYEQEQIIKKIEDEESPEENSYEEQKDDIKDIDIDVQGSFFLNRCCCFNILNLFLCSIWLTDSKEDVSGDAENNSDHTESNSLEENLQKAISTAERRKVYKFLNILLIIIYFLFHSIFFSLSQQAFGW